MLRTWRIVPEARAKNPFDGEGARRFGGRWNSVGLPTVYTAGSRALAALEVLVHLHRPTPPIRYRLFEVRFAKADVEILRDRRAAAAAGSASILNATRRFGDKWLRDARSPVLRIPSSIIPEEENYLLNPRHPRFPELRFGQGVAFAFAPRLLGL